MFTAENGLCPMKDYANGKINVLVTGAADARDPKQAELVKNWGKAIESDITDIARLKDDFNGKGIHTIIHLAATPDASAPWSTLLELNINGTYNVYVAAKAAGVKRVVFASSIHAVSGYSGDVQVKTTDPVNPGDIYGVSKVFGESLGRYMAEREELSVIAIRIGAFQPAETIHKGMGLIDSWVSQRDLRQLIEKCIDVEKIKFAIFNGLSDNRFKCLDISDAKQLLGYTPQDDSFRENPTLSQFKLSDIVVAHQWHGEPDKDGLREDLASTSDTKKQS